MNKLRNGALILIPILLLALFSQVSLARPEQTHDWETHLVGFYLVRDTLDSGPPSIGDPEAGWEEQGSTPVSAYGHTFSIPDMILKAQTGENGELYFPNLEGCRFFLAKEYYDPGNLEEFAYRLYSDLESEGLHMEVTDLGTNHTASGTLYYTAPLNDSTWTEDNQVWTAYQVWQEPDGTVYLADSGNSVSGTVDCSMTKTVTYRENANGQATQENTLDLTINFRYISRLTQVTVEQFTADHRSIAAHTFSAQEMLEEPSEATPSWEEDAAYVIFTEHYANGTVQRTLLERGDEPVSHICWAAEENGLTIPFTITLE